MMTRREKLLVRPWQIRRYNNHKKKVLNAVSVVDFGPPPQRTHVTVKLKKLQKEKERQMKIEEDNFKLLQHLGAIMTKKRVDNYWATELPNFLGRVGIYPRTRTPTPFEETTPKTAVKISGLQKSKCQACTPHPEEPLITPENRIPWEPQKKVLTRRRSNSAVVPVTSDFDLPKQKGKVHTFSHQTIKQDVTKEVEKHKQTAYNFKKTFVLPTLKNLKPEVPSQKIVVNPGPLQIILNFPSFADVKMVSGEEEKYLQRGYCGCKNYKTGNEN